MNSPDTGTANYQQAFCLIHQLASEGVQNAVISPGSRSTPLALACEKHPHIRTWIQIDERSAGYFALGLAKRCFLPSMLICTSGSAVTNWFPAVVEANHAYTPIILISADRPEELQNCGANQTINQQHLFGQQVRQFIQLDNNKIVKSIAALSLYPRPGAVHINLPFREPLLPTHLHGRTLNQFIDQLGEQILASDQQATETVVPTHFIANQELTKLSRILNQGKGIVICGGLTVEEQKDLHPVLKQLSEHLNCPVLLDPLSNIRQQKSTEQYIYNYDLLLRQSNKHLQPDWVIRLGQFPVSKSLMQFLQQLESEVILISTYGDVLDPIHTASHVVHCLPVQFCQQIQAKTNPSKIPSSWLRLWQEKDRQAEKLILDSLQDNHLFEGSVIEVVLNNIPDNSMIFSGNSMAIRDLDTFMTQHSTAGKNFSFFCNRGTSGIDGNVSTFFGLLAGQDNDTYGVALLGDLSFYHDMNGLWITRALKAQGYNAAIILLNNHGGAIFNYLPQRQLEDFEKLWTTDTRLDFKQAAHLYQLDYHRITSPENLSAQLSSKIGQPGIQLIEVIIDPQTSVECHQKLYQTMSENNHQ